MIHVRRPFDFIACANMSTHSLIALYKSVFIDFIRPRKQDGVVSVYAPLILRTSPTIVQNAK